LVCRGDENGVCGKQSLVVGCDLKRFMLLFPEAKITTVGTVGDNTTVANRILELPTKTVQQVLAVKDIERLIGKAWRQISSDVITPFFRKRIEAIGWTYVPVKGKIGRGKQGARFERIAPKMEHEGVLTGLDGGDVRSASAARLLHLDIGLDVEVITSVLIKRCME
jgi:hypothetical protein